MNNPKYTPGPWKLEPIKGTHYQIIAVSTDVVTPIAQTIADEREGVNGEANARLIAAAPELLEALKKAMSIKQLWLPPTPEKVAASEADQWEAEARALHFMHDAIVAAIAKATGGAE